MKKIDIIYIESIHDIPVTRTIVMPMPTDAELNAAPTIEEDDVPDWEL